MRKPALLQLIAVCVAALNANATIFINFDTDANGVPFSAPMNFIDTTRLSEFYAPLGVHFFGPDGADGNDGGAIVNQSGNWGVNAHSGTNFLGFNRRALMMDFGVPQDPEIIRFDTLVNHVSIFAAGGFNADPFLMRGFDENGVLVATDTVTTQNWAELEINWSLGIRYIELSMTSTDPNAAFVFDDLSVEFVPEPSTTSLLICAVAIGVVFRLRRKNA